MCPWRVEMSTSADRTSSGEIRGKGGALATASSLPPSPPLLLHLIWSTLNYVHLYQVLRKELARRETQIMILQKETPQRSLMKRVQDPDFLGLGNQHQIYLKKKRNWTRTKMSTGARSKLCRQQSKNGGVSTSCMIINLSVIAPFSSHGNRITQTIFFFLR